VLKFQYVVNLGLATVLAVPAVTLGAQQNESLEQTLQRTLAALEELAGIEKRLQERDASAIGEAVRLTEAPPPAAAPGTNDAALEQLRADVAGLQHQLDSLESPSAVAETPSTAEVAQDGSSPAPTVGLTPEQLTKLVERRPLVTPPADTKRNKVAFEKKGYTADAAKLGRALYRENRFEEALAAFEAAGADPESRYWRGRCLERSGRVADALAAYETLAQDAAAAPWSQRAASDLEFVRWRAGKGPAKDQGGKSK
jgi:tetratricopeptide (TPR) repeat protein